MASTFEERVRGGDLQVRPTSKQELPSLEDVQSAAHRIKNIATRTPVRTSRDLSALVGSDVELKLETLQPTGAFKVRGAANAMLRQRELGPLDGVVAASTGNHGIAVTHVARKLGIPAVICMSEAVASDRVAMIQDQGAAVDRTSSSQAAAIENAQSIAKARNFLMVPPFDHPDVISGAGTIGLELLEQAPHTQVILVPVSGGGLAAGVALAVKSANPEVHVVAVGAERAPAMRDSLAVGRPVSTVEIPTVASSLIGDLGPENKYTLALVNRFVDDIALMPEEQIIDAMAWALFNERLVVEGAAAVVVAYILQKADRLADKVISAVITGDNVNREALLRASSALRSIEPAEAR